MYLIGVLIGIGTGMAGQIKPDSSIGLKISAGAALCIAALLMVFFMLKAAEGIIGLSESLAATVSGSRYTVVGIMLLIYTGLNVIDIIRERNSYGYVLPALLIAAAWLVYSVYFIIHGRQVAKGYK